MLFACATHIPHHLTIPSIALPRSPMHSSSHRSRSPGFGEHERSLVHARAPCPVMPCASLVFFHHGHWDGAGKLSQHLTEICPISARSNTDRRSLRARPACCKRWFLSASRAWAPLVASPPHSPCHRLALPSGTDVRGLRRYLIIAGLPTA